MSTHQFDYGLSPGDFVEMMHHRGTQDVDGSDTRTVCAGCLRDDSGIAKAIGHFATSRQCDFCERRFRSERAAPIEDVARFVIGCLREDYDIPENVLFYDKDSDYGFAGHVMDKVELLEENLPYDDWDVLDAIAKCITDDKMWCEANPGLFLPHRQLASSWETFSRYVKHSSRYMFLRPDEQRRGYDGFDDNYIPARRMLDLLGEAVLAADLVRTIGPRTRIFRARPVREGDVWYSTALELGPPPSSETGPPAGRMNAAGIPVFYGALELETCLSEALESNGRVSVGLFSPSRPLKVLDLARAEPLPYRSIFEAVTPAMRGLPAFIEAFRDDIAKVTARDGREHIDYVPAQIVTEYFRRVFVVEDGEGGEERLHGILYPSTRNPAGRNVALFVSREEIKGTPFEDPVLRFHPRSTGRFLVTAGDDAVSSWERVAS